MPSLSTAPLPPVKMLLIGDSSAGKTGALASLASAGYNLRIIDLDNGLDILRSLLTDPGSKYDKDAVNRVIFKTLSEPMRVLNNKVVPSRASVWPEMMKLLDKWEEPEADGQPAVNLGPVTKWTGNDILVIDSLTAAATSALNFVQSLNGKLGVSDPSYSQMRDIGAAQTHIGNFLSLLTGKDVPCNVIVISHITYVDDTGAPKIEGESPQQHGYPSAIGKALSPQIPRYFNSMLLAKVEGSGSATRNMLYTKPIGIVGAKSSAPTSTPNSYPLATGLAEYFKAVRGGKGPGD